MIYIQSSLKSIRHCNSIPFLLFEKCINYSVLQNGRLPKSFIGFLPHCIDSLNNLLAFWFWPLFYPNESIDAEIKLKISSAGIYLCWPLVVEPWSSVRTCKTHKLWLTLQHDFVAHFRSWILSKTHTHKHSIAF